MTNVTARYWGIRGNSGTIAIGEVELYIARPGDVGQMNEAIFSNTLYSSSIQDGALAPSLNAAMDGSLTTKLTITDNPFKQYGIALDCEGPVAIRCIAVRNFTGSPGVGGDTFTPFAVDSLNYYVGKSLPVASKIQRYSTLVTEEIDGSINFYFTILPYVETDSPSIARGSLTKQGAC